MSVCRTCCNVAVFRILYVFRASQSHFQADCTSCEIQCSVSGYRGMTAKSSAWPSNCWLLSSLQQASARAGLCYSIIKRNRRTRAVTTQHNAYCNLAVSSCDQYRKAWFCMYCRGVATIIATGRKTQGLTNPLRQMTVFILTDHHQWRTEEGGGWGFNPPPRNSEVPPKSCQIQPDCENC